MTTESAMGTPTITMESPTATPVMRPHHIDAAIDLLGGVAGGCASVLVGQPLDTVKVKLQTFSHLYSGMSNCFIRTLKEEGLTRGLYAGTVPSLVAQVAENAVLFCTYGMCQKTIAIITGKRDVSNLSVVENAFAGSGAAFFASFALCPTELIKCRMQALRQTLETGTGAAATLDNHTLRSHGRISPWGLTRQIVRTEGIQGMFRGLVPTFAREMPGYFFFFGGYEGSKALMLKFDPTKKKLGALETIICGGIGGVCLWTTVFPADVVKSRVQVAPAGAQQEMAFIQTLIYIARTEGITALYRGLTPGLLRTFPATGALFLAYETTKSTLGSLWGPEES